MSANGMNGQANGQANGGSPGGGGGGPEETLRELVLACVRFVERGLGVRLDFEPETLPVLDHYLEEAREGARTQPETALLVAQAAGAYFGEVLRRRHPAWWAAEDPDPALWEVQLESAHLSLRPIGMVLELLRRPPSPELPPEKARGEDEDEEEDDESLDEDEASAREEAGEARREEASEPQADEETLAGLILREQDRPAVAARLAELPAVSEREYYALSTRLEVVDIAVDALHALRVAEGENPELHLTPADYEDAD